MSATDFEYAIKKDVKNNPIVRELDETRQRQLWRSAGIAAMLVAVLLFSAWQHFELVLYSYKMEQMQKARQVEEEVNRHLRLEIESLKRPERIEEVAKTKLKLVAPSPDQAMVIERVTAPAPPVKSLVAAR